MSYKTTRPVRVAPLPWCFSPEGAQAAIPRMPKARHRVIKTVFLLGMRRSTQDLVSLFRDSAVLYHRVGKWHTGDEVGKTSGNLYQHTD